MLPLTAMSHISFKGVCGESELPCASHIRHKTRASVSVEKKKKNVNCVFSAWSWKIASALLLLLPNSEKKKGQAWTREGWWWNVLVLCKEGWWGGGVYVSVRRVEQIFTVCLSSSCHPRLFKLFSVIAWPALSSMLKINKIWPSAVFTRRATPTFSRWERDGLIRFPEISSASCSRAGSKCIYPSLWHWRMLLTPLP